MATLDEIGQEKQRLADRLARLDTDRAKLAERLNELEIAERVLSEFGRSEGTPARRRGRPAATASAARTGGRRPRAAAKSVNVLSLSDAALKAVGAHSDGATAADVMTYLSRELGMAVRPNHLGIALQRHRRAGRLENRDQRWFLPKSSREERPTAISE
jgi:hypothetical protein